MSNRSYLRTKATVSSSYDFVSAQQARSRLPIQTKALESQDLNIQRQQTSSYGESQAAHLDAGLMQNLGIQPKLTIGQPNDKYEQEADSVAAKVVEQINAPQAQQQAVQREAMPTEEDVQTKPMLQRVSEGGESASAEFEASLNSARGGGQPLDANLQRSIGQSMGADFSGVRVHTDARSDQLNRSIQARAFTTGQDVFFRQGEYQPNSRSGQELLAHELTHVVQQSG